MRPFKAIVLGLVAPAAAIVIGALLQQFLIWVWPGVQALTIFNVSLDTCLCVVVMGCLTFLGGSWDSAEHAGTRHDHPGDHRSEYLAVSLSVRGLCPRRWMEHRTDRLYGARIGSAHRRRVGVRAAR